MPATFRSLSFRILVGGHEDRAGHKPIVSVDDGTAQKVVLEKSITQK